MYCKPSVKADGTVKNTMIMMTQPDLEMRQEFIAGPSWVQIPESPPLVSWALVFSSERSERGGCSLLPETTLKILGSTEVLNLLAMTYPHL